MSVDDKNDAMCERPDGPPGDWARHEEGRAGQPLLSVILPTYNEERRLGPTLERVTAYLASQPYTWELLVVDDGSVDQTVLTARVFAEQWPQMRILTAERNGGKGDAVRRGVFAARGAYTLFSDADLATPISEVGRVLPLLQGDADVVIGSRAMPDSRIVTAQPLRRRVMGRVFRRLVHGLALRGVRDSQCGFKGFRTTAARHIFGQLTIERFAFDVEVLLLAQELGYRTREIGVSWADVPGTTVSPFRDSATMLRDIYGMRGGVRARLDAARTLAPGAHDRTVSLITVHQTSGRDDLPLGRAIETARRAADTVVVEQRPGTALVTAFGVTTEEAGHVANRLATATSEALATQGQSSAVTVDLHPLPLATPVRWLREPITPAATPRDATRTEASIAAERHSDDQRMFTQGQADWKRRRRAVRALIAFNVLGLIWWLDWLFRPSNAANGLLYTLLVLAECFNVVQVLGYWYTVWHERAPERKRARVEGRVDVFIATYNESVEVVEETVRAAVAMPYPHRTYVLDDGNRPEMAALAARHGARWVTRSHNRGAKAGNINHALTVTDADFFAVFDADHVPQPHFLDRMMPSLADPRVAFVQAPQYYANRGLNYVTEGAMDQQELFFGPICKGKDGLGAVFCCGTNMVMRRAAVEEVGGFREDSITEDAVTSLDLHEHGWTSRYVGERLADGLAPEDLGAYVSQQRRWARGNIEMLLHFGILRRHMPLRLRFQYAWSAMYYLTSLTTVLYMALPCLFLLFGIQTVSALSTDFIAHFLPYIFTTIFILARSAEGRLRFRAIQLSYGLFPVFTGAFYAVVSGRKAGFTVTPKEGRTQSFYHLVVPQLTVAAISALSILVGFAHYAGPATVTNACWALFNVIMLSAIIRAAAPQRANVLARAKADVAGVAPDIAEKVSA